MTSALPTGLSQRPELNGKSACVVDYDVENDRYYADIEGVGRASLQLINLILPVDTRGKVVGLTSEKGSRWNDKVGKVRCGVRVRVGVGVGVRVRVWARFDSIRLDSSLAFACLCLT